MVVPFQMVMFTLSSWLADTPRHLLNTPWVLWIIYLGFGAGLAVFMFCGFMRSVPHRDRGGLDDRRLQPACRPISTSCSRCCKPTMISVGILEAMWIWNDYLLPTLMLDIRQVQDHLHAHPVLPAAATAAWRWAR